MSSSSTSVEQLGRSLLDYSINGSVSAPTDSFTHLWHQIETRPAAELTTIINHRDESGRTALHHGCIRQTSWLVKRLLSLPQLDLNVQDGQGQTGLHLALKMIPSNHSSTSASTASSTSNSCWIEIASLILDEEERRQKSQLTTASKFTKSSNDSSLIAHKATRDDSVRLADVIARAAATWFTYTTGPMVTEHQGQCGDFAVMFILTYNAAVGKNVARLVTTNNPIPSGTYRLSENKVDVAKLGFHGFKSGASGFLSWNKVLYIYHPVLGAYPIVMERAWTPKRHFGVNMLDKRQVHTWASIGDVSVDPTYFYSWPKKFPSPLGHDE